MEQHEERSHNIELGKRGEDAAARYLTLMGYTILERNYRCPCGEADIIAEDGESLHFIEVKTRSNIEHGFPSEAVNARKRERYEKIALYYLSTYEGHDVRVLFDIISIVATSNNRALLRFHQNAFGSSV